jgi:hypothetical protein
VTGARHLFDEPREEDAYDVGRIGELEPGRAITGLGEHVDQQRERQRMAVGHVAHPLVQSLRHATGPQQRASVAAGEIAQRDHPQQLAPAAVRQPRGARRLAPRDDRERLVAERGEVVVAHPRLQATDRLEGVQEQHASARRPPPRGVRRPPAPP